MSRTVSFSRMIPSSATLSEKSDEGTLRKVSHRIQMLQETLKTTCCRSPRYMTTVQWRTCALCSRLCIQPYSVNSKYDHQQENNTESLLLQAWLSNNSIQLSRGNPASATEINIAGPEAIVSKSSMSLNNNALLLL